LSDLDTALLDKFVAWMIAGGVTRLTYAKGTTSITLRLPGEAAGPDLAPAAPRVVRSPAMGTFTARHPLAAEAYAKPGRTVATGEIVGLLAVGPILTAVVAPCGGRISRLLVDDGAVVGFDDPLIEIQAAEAPSRR